MVIQPTLLIQHSISPTSHLITDIISNFHVTLYFIYSPYPNDGRCLLGGGPFSRIAAVMSHNYMIHHPPKEEFKWILRDRTSEFDIDRFVLHVHSYLTSLQLVKE